MISIDELRDRRRAALLNGLVIGMLAGALAASLLAPRSGSKTRELVIERGLELKDRVADRISRVRAEGGSPL